MVVARLGLHVLVLVLLAGTAMLLSATAFMRSQSANFLASLMPAGRPRLAVVRLSLMVALGLVSFLVLLELVAAAGFIFGISIGKHVLFLSAVCSAFVLGVVSWRTGFAKPLIAFGFAVVTCVVVISGAVFFAGQVYDVSWDGGAYHQVAVVDLEAGWNPIRQPNGPTRYNSLWIDSYPKGSWIEGAVVYSVTNRLEQAKAPSLILGAACFFIWLALLLALAPQHSVVAALFAFLVSANPVALVQAPTFMVDGRVAALVSVAVAAGIFALSKKTDWATVLLFAGSLLLLSTTKFTALVYAGLIGLALTLALTWLRRKRPAVRVAAAVTVAILLGVFLVGLNPYVFNTVRHGSPFYPLSGPDRVDIMAPTTPVDLEGMNRLEKLGVSLLAASHNRQEVRSITRLKVPFTVEADEVPPYREPDTRIGGFGPFYGGAVLLSAALMVVLLFDWRRTRDARLLATLALSVVLTGTALINPEAWWARYVPQLWLVPLALSFAGVAFTARSTSKSIGWIVAAAMLANVLFVGTVNASAQRAATARVDSALSTIASTGLSLDVKPGSHEAFVEKLAERQVDFSIVASDAPMIQPVKFPYWDAVMAPRAEQ